MRVPALAASALTPTATPTAKAEAVSLRARDRFTALLRVMLLMRSTIRTRRMAVNGRTFLKLSKDDSRGPQELLCRFSGCGRCCCRGGRRPANGPVRRGRPHGATLRRPPRSGVSTVISTMRPSGSGTYSDGSSRGRSVRWPRRRPRPGFDGGLHLGASLRGRRGRRATRSAWRWRPARPDRRTGRRRGTSRRPARRTCGSRPRGVVASHQVATRGGR